MKLQALLLSLAFSAAQAAPSAESLKAFSWDLKVPAFHFVPAARVPEPAPPPFGPMFRKPRVAPAPPQQKAAVIARVDLAAQLDRQRDLFAANLGPKRWDVGLASDAGVDHYYLTFRNGSVLRIAPLGDLNRLRGAGVDIEVEPGVVYNFRLSINLFSPVRGSTIKLRPARGTRGSDAIVSTGALLDAARARAAVFVNGGKEYWVFYGTDVDQTTGLLTSTRTFLFVQFDGLSTRAWPIAESALPLGQPMRVSLISPVTVTRTAADLFIAR